MLIHGLRPHPLSETNVWEPELSSWEEAFSPLVKKLTADADVYSLAYGQNGSVDEVARVRSLGQHIAGLRSAGYSWAEIAHRLGITRQAAHQRWAGHTP